MKILTTGWMTIAGTSAILLGIVGLTPARADHDEDNNYRNRQGHNNGRDYQIDRAYSYSQRAGSDHRYQDHAYEDTHRYNDHRDRDDHRYSDHVGREGYRSYDHAAREEHRYLDHRADDAHRYRDHRAQDDHRFYDHGY